MAARFVDDSESEIDQFNENAVPQKTKEATNHQGNSSKIINIRNLSTNEIAGNSLSSSEITLNMAIHDLTWQYTGIYG